MRKRERERERERGRDTERDIGRGRERESRVEEQRGYVYRSIPNRCLFHLGIFSGKQLGAAAGSPYPPRDERAHSGGGDMAYLLE